MPAVELPGMGLVHCKDCTYNPDGHCHLWPPKPFLIGARNALGESVPQIVGAFSPVQDNSYCAYGVSRPVTHQESIYPAN